MQEGPDSREVGRVSSTSGLLAIRILPILLGTQASARRHGCAPALGEVCVGDKPRVNQGTQGRAMASLDVALAVLTSEIGLIHWPWTANKGRPSNTLSGEARL